MGLKLVTISLDDAAFIRSYIRDQLEEEIVSKTSYRPLPRLLLQNYP